MTTTDEAPKTTAEEPPTADLPERVGPARPRVRLGRPLVAGLLAAALTALLVLLATGLRGDEYEARIGLLATPAAPAAGTTAQYGEVVALTLPALVEVARSPSVLRAAAEATGTPAGELGEHVAVELVPASGLARLSVRASSPTRASAAATAIARSMVDARLLAPVGALRLLDERPDVAQVAPDSRLGLGLALAAAVVAGVTVAALCHLRRPGHAAVRAALAAAGTRHPVTTARADEPDLPERLAALCAAADLTPRVVAVTPAPAAQATALARLIPDTHCGPGIAVIAVTPCRGRQDDLAAVAGALPADSMLLAVVLA
jgi:capsular polysaccharide biosynthesis protein